MKISKIATISSHYVPEKEFQELYETLTMDNNYCFSTAMYDEGLILYVLPAYSEWDIETEKKYPVTFKIIKFARSHDLTYIDLYHKGNRLDEITVLKYNLEYFNW